MGKGIILVLIVLGMTLSVIMQPAAAAAADTRDLLNRQYSLYSDICPPVKNAFKERLDILDVVRTAIQMGHNACYVIRCAVEGGATLDQVILGAVAGGTSADIISRCATDAGARPAEVAEVLRREGLLGLGYTPAEGGSPVVIGFPGAGRNGGAFVSPSKF